MTNDSRDMDIINQIPQAAFALDTAGTIRVWNHNMEELTGIRAEEIVGRGGFEHSRILFGERRPTLINDILGQGNPGDGLYRNLIRNKDQIYAESCVPLTNGKQVACTAAPLYNTAGIRIGAIEALYDITEKRAAENSLQRSEEQIRTLTHALPDMFFTIDHNGIFLEFSWNEAQKYGIDPGSLVGRGPDALFPEEEAGFIAATARAVIDTGQNTSQERKFMWHGEERAFRTDLHPLHDTSGKIVAASGISRDISNRIRSERTVQETTRVTNLYLDLLSNDIYNTSMVAATIIEMLRERLEGEEEELAQRVKATIEQNINIIKNVELLNTLSQHRTTLGPVDLDALVREQIRRYSGIRIRYSGCHCTVWANPLLEHIISNLISNSIKYGGMRVEIDISALETEEVVTLTVADNGIGIPDPLKPNIFDRFTRGGKKMPGSRGLGLHIVKTLVNQYGGRVWAADRVPGKPGEGAAIKIILQKC